MSSDTTDCTFLTGCQFDAYDIVARQMTLPVLDRQYRLSMSLDAIALFEWIPFRVTSGDTL